MLGTGSQFDLDFKAVWLKLYYQEMTLIMNWIMSHNILHSNFSQNLNCLQRLKLSFTDMDLTNNFAKEKPKAKKNRSLPAKAARKLKTENIENELLKEVVAPKPRDTRDQLNLNEVSLWSMPQLIPQFHILSDYFCSLCITALPYTLDWQCSTTFSKACIGQKSDQHTSKSKVRNCL